MKLEKNQESYISTGFCDHGKPRHVMEYEWLIFRPAEDMTVFQTVRELNGKINNKTDIMAQHKMWYSWWYYNAASLHGN